MALEDELRQNTAAINGLTAVLSKGLPAGAATSAATAGKPGRPAKVKVPSEEDVAAAAAKVKQQFDSTGAKWLIKNKGGADKMSGIPEDKRAEFIAACEKAVEAGEIEGMDDDGGTEDL